MDRQSGFTLIELMVVVAIIAILSAIAIPAYQDYVVRSQVAEGVALGASAKLAVSEYYSQRGTYPANNLSAGLSSPASIRGSYVSQVSVGDGGRITVSYLGSKASAKLASETLVLQPSDTGGSISWECVSMPSRYLPSSCRGE